MNTHRIRGGVPGSETVVITEEVGITSMSHLQSGNARAPTRYLNSPRDIIKFI
jgi:hypothetical protein